METGWGGSAPGHSPALN